MAQYKLPPRQKMINLLYVILIAMLAINISSDVLDGFITANRDAVRAVDGLKDYNQRMNARLTDKDAETVEKVQVVQNTMKGFSEKIAQMKEAIRLETQKSSMKDSEADIDDDLNAVKTVMLGDNGKATEVKSMLEKLKEVCTPMLIRESSRELISTLLNTTPHDRNSSWEEEHFANLPSIGGMMMLNQLERNMWLVTNETLRNLEAKEGEADSVEVQPKVEVPELDNNLVKALIAQLSKSNAMQESKNVVKDEKGEIKAIVLTENQAPLFANFENVLDVTVATPNGELGGYTMEMTNGKVQKSNKGYVAIPNADAKEATLTVKMHGKKLFTREYQVIPLPAPTPYLTYLSVSGKTREYRSNVPLTGKEMATLKEINLKMEGVNTGEKVAEFDMIVIKNGNKTVITEHAQGAALTANMQKVLKTVVKGDRVFFTNIVVKGELTSARQVASVNVIPM